MNAPNAPLSENTATTALEPEINDRIRDTLAASKSKNTLKQYKSALRGWSQFCEETKCDPLDPSFDKLAAHLTGMVAAGKSLATVKMTVAAISWMQRQNGSSPASLNENVKTLIEGIARQLADRPIKQARALDAESVAVVRGHLNGSADRSHRAAVTMAICSMLAESGLRISEAAALQWQHIEFDTEGATITVVKSKTDGHGEGATVAVTAAAASDLQRIRPVDASPESPVFGLTAQSIGNRIAAITRKAGLGDGFSGHSGRVGLCVRMVKNAAPVASICRQGRWQSSRMVTRYSRKLVATDARQYL